MRLFLIGAMAAFTTAAMAQPELAISLGVRETGSTAAIGEDGGTDNGIEWIGLDGQTLVLDGTWQQFTFDMDQLSVDAFAGTTADGVLDGEAGTIEHIRILNASGTTAPISLWIDDVANTISSRPGISTTTTIGDFEGFVDGDQVIFQEPGFSGSTSGNITGTPNFGGVDSSMALNGDASYNVQFTYASASTSGWVRLTTFATPNLPNPTISFVDDSVVSFWIKGVPEPSSLMLLGLGALGLIRRR